MTNFLRHIFLRHVTIIFFSVLVASCAGTSIKDSWVEENHPPFNHPMIIGISDSQQTRQIFEKHFVAELKKRNISATPSYKLINSKQELNRKTVVAALTASDIPIDSVLVTYLVPEEAKVNHGKSPLSGGYADAGDRIQMSETVVSTRGHGDSTEIVFLKNDLFSVETRSIVWSAHTKTVAPPSIDKAIEEVVDILIDKMISDNILQ